MYLIAFLSIFIGMYKEFLITFILIIIHELGHLTMAKILKIPTKQITLYPLGGLCKLEMDISENPKKELLVIIMGPVFQEIAYIVLVALIKEKEIIQTIHYGILSFNLLPILPLDGGKITNIIINYFLPYKRSFQISIVISYLITISILFIQKKMSINIIMIYSVLMILIHKEKLKEKLYFHKLLMERLLKNYPFKKKKYITNIKKIYRYRNNFIKDKNEWLSERKYLFRKYEKISKNY